MHGFFSTACLLLASVSAVFAANSPGCGKAKTITNKQYTMTVNGKTRNYFVNVPDNYNQNNPYRIVYEWHQRGASAQKIVNGENPNAGGVLPFYGLKAIAQNTAIFVVPDGLNQGWANTNGEDVTFFDQLLKTVEDDLCVNTNLRFATGFSYGGGMSYALACARPDKIRAVAVISGAQLSGCNGGNTPVAFYGQHGTSDSVLNVSMGRQLRDKYVGLNGCQKLPNEPQPNGGNSVNSIASDAGYEVRLTAADATQYQGLVAKVTDAVKAGVAAENDFRGVKDGDLTSGVPANVRVTITPKAP